LDLEGNLGVFEPVSIFQTLNIARVSGELTIDTGHNSARVFFDRGDVVFAEINHRPVRLGEALVAAGRIQQSDLNRVLVRNRKGKKLGKLLVADGAIDEASLRAALEEQIKEVIYEVVRWRKGWFRFYTGRQPRDNEIAINIPLDHLMLEGVKRMDEQGDSSG